MSADDLRLKLAVNTACEIAEAQGLQFERAIASQITEAEGIKHYRVSNTKTGWNQTFHNRSGCGTNINSYSAFVETVTGGNANHTVVKYLVTIDDDDNAGKRTLKIRDIRPINLRNDN